MNYKIEKLLHEGFSMKTLDTFTSNQIDVLYHRVINEQTSGGVLNIPSSDSASIQAAKTNKQKFVTYEKELDEKALSKKQRGLMGAAYSVEKGDKKLKDIPKSYRDKVKDVVDSMSKKQVKDFASTKNSELGEGDKKFIQKATKKMESKGTEGKFGSWCKKQGLDSDGEVTKKCINAGLKSDDSSVVKMANFAKNIGGFKGSEHKKKSETKENVKGLEESIMKLIENHLPPTTTKSELLNSIKRFKR